LFVRLMYELEGTAISSLSRFRESAHNVLQKPFLSILKQIFEVAY
jgi:hypothetical protein